MTNNFLSPRVCKRYYRVSILSNITSMDLMKVYGL